MKVLQINSVCGFGSTGRITTDLYKILEEQGHECVIAYGRGNAPEGIRTIKIGTNLDNYVHVAKTRLFDKHGFSSIKATKEFIRKVEKYNPDIIHLHNIHGYYINIEILFNYLKRANKKVIWTLHDCWSFTGHCPYFDYVGCDKWKNCCYSCPQKMGYPSSLFFDNSRENYQKKKDLFNSIDNLTIVTPSRWLAGLVKQSFLGKYPIEVINNGVDLNIFKPTPSNFRVEHGLLDKVVVLGVANIWEKRKGLDDFIEISKQIDEQYKIVLVGLSAKQLKRLPNNIIGVSRTNNLRELSEIYSAADVFFNPTYEDNYPTTNLEALACGTPVITYDTGGSPECINDKNGIIIKKEEFQIECFKVAISKMKKMNNIDLNVINKINCYGEYGKLYERYK